jgi:hypothetical protein
MKFALLSLSLLCQLAIGTRKMATGYHDSTMQGTPVYVVPEDSIGSFPQLPGMAIKWDNGTVSIIRNNGPRFGHQPVPSPQSDHLGSIPKYSRISTSGGLEKTLRIAASPPPLKVKPVYPVVEHKLEPILERVNPTAKQSSTRYKASHNPYYSKATRTSANLLGNSPVNHKSSTKPAVPNNDKPTTPNCPKGA